MSIFKMSFPLRWRTNERLKQKGEIRKKEKFEEILSTFCLSFIICRHLRKFGHFEWIEAHIQLKITTFFQYLYKLFILLNTSMKRYTKHQIFFIFIHRLLVTIVIVCVAIPQTFNLDKYLSTQTGTARHFVRSHGHTPPNIDIFIPTWTF